MRSVLRKRSNRLMERASWRSRKWHIPNKPGICSQLSARAHAETKGRRSYKIYIGSGERPNKRSGARRVRRPNKSVSAAHAPTTHPPHTCTHLLKLWCSRCGWGSCLGSWASRTPCGRGRRRRNWSSRAPPPPSRGSSRPRPRWSARPPSPREETWLPALCPPPRPTRRTRRRRRLQKKPYAVFYLCWPTRKLICLLAKSSLLEWTDIKVKYDQREKSCVNFCLLCVEINISFILTDLKVISFTTQLVVTAQKYFWKGITLKRRDVFDFVCSFASFFALHTTRIEGYTI